MSGDPLDAANWGLVPRSSALAVAELALRRNRARDVDEDEIARTLARERSAVAHLIGAAEDEIALAP